MRCVIWLALIAAALGADASAFAGQPDNSKLDAALQDSRAAVDRVIIQTTRGQAANVATRVRTRGRPVFSQFTIIDAVTAELGSEDLAALQADADVTSISIDAVVASASVNGATNTFATTIGVPLAGLTGKGVGIAVIDSGLALNGDFSSVAFYDFTRSQQGSPYDEYGHGTHVSGLIASKGTLSQGAYSGVASRSKLIELKVLDAGGRGQTSTVIAAIEFVVANKDTLGIDVINLSLGHPIFETVQTDPLVQAVEAATRAGIVVVVAAGNVGRSPSTGLPGYAGILSPANAPSAITVGALDTRNTIARGDDAVAPYSSRGPTWYDALPKPDLVAPGQSLISDAAIGSTLYSDFPNARITGNGGAARFLRLNGTSMAAAVTSGVVALVIEASRTAFGTAPTPATIKSILAYTALPLDGVDPLTQGHGALNASGAISLTLAAGAAGWPDIALTTLVSPATTTDGTETWTWAQDADWGDTVVWGSTGEEPAWAQTVVWGSVDWGDTVVWGSTDSGDTVVWGSTHGIN